MSGKLLVRGRFVLYSLAGPCPLPDFRFWDALILRLKAAGLTPAQIAWGWKDIESAQDLDDLVEPRAHLHAGGRAVPVRHLRARSSA